MQLSVICNHMVDYRRPGRKCSLKIALEQKLYNVRLCNYNYVYTSGVAKDFLKYPVLCQTFPVTVAVTSLASYVHMYITIKIHVIQWMVYGQLRFQDCLKVAQMQFVTLYHHLYIYNTPFKQLITTTIIVLQTNPISCTQYSYKHNNINVLWLLILLASCIVA